MGLKSLIQNSARTHPFKAGSYIGFNLTIALGYFFLARLGLTLATINEAVSPVWPATGLAIGLISIMGYRFLPAITLGALATNILSTDHLAVASFIALGNTTEAFIGAFVINQLQGKKEWFSHFFNTISIIVASVIGAIFSATIGCTTLIIFKAAEWTSFSRLWLTWWTGDTLGGIVIIPLVVLLYRSIFIKTIIPRINLTFCFLLLFSGLFLSWLIFILPNGAPFLFLVFPYLLWCVERSNEKGVIFATILLSVCGVLSIKYGYGIFFHGNTNTNLLNLQFFLASIGVCSLVLSDLKRVGSLKKPSFVFILCWLLAGLLFWGYYQKAKKDSEERFVSIVESVGPLLKAKVDLYFSALQNGTSLFAASENVTDKEWSQFIRHGNFFQNLPGVKWMGVVFSIPKNEIPAFLKNQQKMTPAFNLKQLKRISQQDIDSASQLNDAFIVTYMEPVVDYYDPVGLDLSIEPRRRKAAEISRDLGIPSISQSVTLDSEKKLIKAFMAFFPFYKNIDVPQSLNERRKTIVGWTFSPIVIDEFFQSIFSEGALKQLSFALYENDKLNVLPIIQSEDFTKLSEDPLVRVINIGNQNLLFHFKRSSAFYLQQDEVTSWAGAIMAIISILLGTFIVSLQSTKSAALALVHQTHAQLKSSEELLELALESSGDSVWDWDISTNVIHYTALIKRMLGLYEHGPLFGSFEQWIECVHPEDRQKAISEIESTIKGQAEYSSEFRLLCANGEYKWFHSRGKIVSRDNNEKPLRMVGTVADITQRIKALTAIENERAKLNSIFEGTSDGLILYSAGKGFIDCNNTAVRMFGFSGKKELLSQLPQSLSIDPQPFETNLTSKAGAEIKKAYSSGKSHFEWVFQRKNGETFTGEVVLSAFLYEKKDILLVAIRDISEKKFYEASLRKQREMLEASAKMSSLGEMAGGIAHEINNPLSVILGKTLQIKRQLKNQNIEKAMEDLNLVESTAKRISAIIKGLKAFSRNADKDQMQKVLVPALIRDIIELSKERFKFNNVTLTFNQNVNDETAVCCRAAQLLQVLTNLLNNAFDAVVGLDEKWVTIDLNTQDDYCILSVTDSGKGIDPSLAEKIMNPFFTTKPVDKGTGLGLSISKTIIEEHKGRLYYDSSSKNTRFIVELPLAEIQEKSHYH